MKKENSVVFFQTEVLPQTVLYIFIQHHLPVIIVKVPDEFQNVIGQLLRNPLPTASETEEPKNKQFKATPKQLFLYLKQKTKGHEKHMSVWCLVPETEKGNNTQNQ